jgi:transcriptional antiterminator RfaH
MPLLPLEPCVFPTDLLDRPAAEEEGALWWVLHTRPRAEKTLARQCTTQGLPFYLPLYQKRWRSGGRSQTSYLPLFPSYLFLYGDYQVRTSALETNLVVQVLPVADQHALYTDLRRVGRLIDSGSALSPEDRLPPGMPVRVTSGPLAGLEGKVVRHEKGTRLFIEVRLLQRGVSIEIDGDAVEPLR